MAELAELQAIQPGEMEVAVEPGQAAPVEQMAVAQVPASQTTVTSHSLSPQLRRQEAGISAVEGATLAQGIDSTQTALQKIQNYLDETTLLGHEAGLAADASVQNIRGVQTANRERLAKAQGVLNGINVEVESNRVLSGPIWKRLMAAMLVGAGEASDASMGRQPGRFINMFDRIIAQDIQNQKFEISQKKDTAKTALATAMRMGADDMAAEHAVGAAMREKFAQKLHATAAALQGTTAGAQLDQHSRALLLASLRDRRDFISRFIGSSSTTTVSGAGGAGKTTDQMASKIESFLPFMEKLKEMTQIAYEGGEGGVYKGVAAKMPSAWLSSSRSLAADRYGRQVKAAAMLEGRAAMGAQGFSDMDRIAFERTYGTNWDNLEQLKSLHLTKGENAIRNYVSIIRDLGSRGYDVRPLMDNLQKAVVIQREIAGLDQ